MDERQIMSLDEVQEKYGQLATLRELFYDWMGLNKWLFLQINHIRGEFYDNLMLWITQLGNRHNFPYFMALLLAFAVLALLWRKLRKKAALRQYILRWITTLCVLALGFVAVAVVVGGAKHYFAFPRPFVAIPQGELNTAANEKVYQIERLKSPDDARASFPSGHVAIITLMVAGLWPLLSQNMRYVGAFLIFAVAWSRVSLGMHFPADTVWSFLLVLLLVKLVRMAVGKAFGAFGWHS